MSEVASSAIESAPERRIYEVVLTDEQVQRMENYDFDISVDIKTIQPNDVLDVCVAQSKTRGYCFMSEDGEAVVMPGSEIAFWLNQMDGNDALSGRQFRSRKPYADAYSSYPRKAFLIPLDRCSIPDGFLV